MSFPMGEWRRLQAVRLNDQAWKHRDIAQALDVTSGAVSRWLAATRRDGSDALRSRPPKGRVPRLSAEQKRLIPDFLWHGAEAYGFRGDVWTCRRVAGVLAEEFNVRYSKSQVSRLLKDLGWTPQIPLTRAIQRDEEAIEAWRKEKWPMIRQQAQKERRTLVFIDESGFYLLPGVVKTYAPKGLTPILQEWQTHDHLSVMGALTSQAKVYTLVRQESLNGLHTVLFLTHLLRVVGERLLVIWDGSPIHRRREVKEFLAQGASRRIHIEPLPFYAPDLNPVEWQWAYIKGVELRNLAYLDLEDLHLQFHLALGRMRQRPRLLTSFFAGACLEL
ncbi:MAG: Transposase [Chthoniobacteraceae bacterium]|nr:Transposase [Chthoniobacteraceae bacterium]